jgi:N6-adenosine-specific RNA methylase IME4
MSRCADFYKKWERDPNWCEKCASSVRQINKYIDLLDSFEERGISKERTIVCLPETNARALISIQDENIKEKAISHIENVLNRKTPQGGGYTQKLTVGDVAKIIRTVAHENKIVDLPIPKGKFNVILADPPWRYQFVETESRAIENHYPSMELEEIKALRIPSDTDSVLYLWATAPKLEEALQVLNAWGFTYKTCAVWDKERKGMGYWFRIQHELLLVGVKGNFATPEPENRFDSIFRSPREEHSKKPEIVYEMIEQMFPTAKYLEVFARNIREGWASWGNQI